MKDEKRIEFEFQIRKPTPGTVAAALYVLGMAMTGWSVPRSDIVPVTVAEVTVYAVAFIVAPALLRRRGGPE